MGQDSGKIHGAVGKGLAPPDFGFDDKKPIDGLALYPYGTAPVNGGP